MQRELNSLKQQAKKNHQDMPREIGNTIQTGAGDE